MRYTTTNMRLGIDMRAYSNSQYGGIVEYIRNVVRYMVQQERTGEFKLFYSSKKHIEPLFLDTQFSHTQNYFYNYPSKLFFLSTQLLQKPSVDVLLKGVDVFFSPHILPVALSNNTPQVLVVHDVSFQRFPQFFDTKRRMWHKAMHIKKQVRSAHHIITPSHATKADLMSLYSVDSQKISVVPLGVSRTTTQQSAHRWEALQKQFSISKPYILSLCVLEPRKNITTLIRAFNDIANKPAFQNLKLVVAGPYGWSYKDILQQARTSQFQERIIITGAIPEELKYELYCNASVFVYPSFFEGFGLQPLEAMSAGVPVVASHTSSIPEVVGNAALFIDPRNAKQIAAVIQELLGDKELQHHLTHAGLDRVQKFSWEKCATQTFNILKQVGKDVVQ